MPIKILNKKVIYCFLSGVLTSLLVFSESYRPPGYSMLLECLVIGIIPSMLFPMALLVTEREVSVNNIKKFLFLSSMLYLLFAISMWITTIHNFFIPIALLVMSAVYPYVVLVAYYNLVKKVRLYKTSRNWIVVLSVSCTIVFILAAFIKIHWLHHIKYIFEERMMYYFLFVVWTCPIWQTGFAIAVTMEK